MGADIGQEGPFSMNQDDLVHAMVVRIVTGHWLVRTCILTQNLMKFADCSHTSEWGKKEIQE